MNLMELDDSAVLEPVKLPFEALDKTTGLIRTEDKGRRVRIVRLREGALKIIRE